MSLDIPLKSEDTFLSKPRQAPVLLQLSVNSFVFELRFSQRQSFRFCTAEVPSLDIQTTSADNLPEALHHVHNRYRNPSTENLWQYQFLNLNYFFGGDDSLTKSGQIIIFHIFHQPGFS